jgi:hypothetical protein
LAVYRQFLDVAGLRARNVGSVRRLSWASPSPRAQ